tara:strand:- start:375 stop:1070 length:696 start_codon:yes stop_codon:yes gene_type:complete
MIKDNKLIFWTGAPGSKWSATAWCLSKTKKLDIDSSDQAEHRCYIVDDERWPGIRHVGSYFGPGFEFGHNFHKINTLTKDEIKEEISKVFDENDKFKIVRCHQFVYHLDWIRDTFPESKIVVVWRKPEISWNGWISAGGFDITHPNYNEYYKDEETAKKLIYEEANLGSKWMFDNDLDMHVACKSHYVNHWGIPFTGAIVRNIRQIEGWFETNPDPYANIKYDVLLGYHNF